MRASMSKKSLIIGIFFFMLLLLAGNASSEVEPIYAGWTVGDSWDDGSGTSYGTILRSTDSGETWIRQGADQIAEVGMMGVFAVDPYTAWVVGNSDNGYATIYHTSDGGITWERKGSSNEASVDYVPDVNLAKVHAAGDDVWAVSKYAILHSSDDGATWTAWTTGDGLQGVYTLDGKIVWVTGGTRPWVPYPDNPYGIILKTTDAGQTWTSRDVDFDDSPGFDAILGISAVDADTAWAVGGGDSVLLKTTDGGATWTQGPDLGGWGDLNEVYAVNSSTVWVAGDGGIFWSTDGGLNWDGHNAGPYIMGVSAVSSQEAWASGTGRDRSIYHTTNGGTTWTRIEQLNGEDLPDMNNISFATLPITDYLIDLMVEVVAFVEVGYMNKGQGNALIVKLEHALDHLINDRRVATVNVLGAFSNQVDAFIQNGVLPGVLGYRLIDRANDFIELISSSL